MSAEEFIRAGCRDWDNAFIRYPGFDISMVCFDWLHVIDLALIPDAVGSVTGSHLFLLAFAWLFLSDRKIMLNEALLELSADDSVWSGTSQDERLRFAYQQLASLCKRCKIRALAFRSLRCVECFFHVHHPRKSRQDLFSEPGRKLF